MKFAILIYAILPTHTGDETQRFISWNLPFENYYKCASFYKDNLEKLQEGVKDHAKQIHKKEFHIKEMGCVHATHHTDRDPTLKNFQPLYKSELL